MKKLIYKITGDKLVYTLNANESHWIICTVPEQIKVKKINQHSLKIYSTELRSYLLVTDRVIIYFRGNQWDKPERCANYIHRRDNIVRALNDCFGFYLNQNFELYKEKTNV